MMVRARELGARRLPCRRIVRLVGSPVLEASEMEKSREAIDRLLQIPQESDVWRLGVEQYAVRRVGSPGERGTPG